MLVRRAVVILAVMVVLGSAISVSLCTDYTSTGVCRNNPTNPPGPIDLCRATAMSDDGRVENCAGDCRTITGNMGGYCDASNDSACETVKRDVQQNVSSYPCCANINRSACVCETDDPPTQSTRTVKMSCCP